MRRAAVDFPFVPTTCTASKLRWGFPSRAKRACIRSVPNPSSGHGERDSSHAVAGPATVTDASRLCHGIVKPLQIGGGRSDMSGGSHRVETATGSRVHEPEGARGAVLEPGVLGHLAVGTETRPLGNATRALVARVRVQHDRRFALSEQPRRYQAEASGGKAAAPRIRSQEVAHLERPLLRCTPDPA